MRAPSKDSLVLIYTVGVLGAFLQISGGYWDVSWHILGLVETFFTVPHSFLYAGVVLALGASAIGFVLRFTVFRREEGARRLLTGLLVSSVGGGLQLVAGPFDFWWHSNFGFDPFLFTPSHTLLISGIVLVGLGMALGSIRILRAYQSDPSLGRFGASLRWLNTVTVVSLTTLWLVLNSLVYLITDVGGIAYTFNLGQDFVRGTFLSVFVGTSVVLLALTGTLALFTAKRVLKWRGAVTIIAIISAAVSATANLGFRAFILAGGKETLTGLTGSGISSFIPIYLSFIIPVVLFDFFVDASASRTRLIVAGALIGPFASFLDGFRSVDLWVGTSSMIVVLIAPMLVAGITAGFLSTRFGSILMAEKTIVAAQQRA
ncbi:MAG: hypothetical protein HYU39_10180 [Thaumarchaeota archaeon]|nr:hypothetical protein [Nitrososphaerota archaeon]